MLYAISEHEYRKPEQGDGALHPASQNSMSLEFSRVFRSYVTSGFQADVFEGGEAL